MTDLHPTRDKLVAIATEQAKTIAKGLAELPGFVQNDLSTLHAADSLVTSLIALRYAQDALGRAPGTLGLPDERGHRTEACDLRDRVAAAARLLTAAIDQVERDGTDLTSHVKKSLAVE